MTVARLMREMTAEEWDYWAAYESLDPFGGERGDQQAALVAAACLSPWRGEGAEPVEPADLAPDWGGLRAEREAREAARQRRRGQGRGPKINAAAWAAWAARRRQ